MEFTIRLGKGNRFTSESQCCRTNRNKLSLSVTLSSRTGSSSKTILFYSIFNNLQIDLCAALFSPNPVSFWAIDHNTKVSSHSKWHWQTTNSLRIRSLMSVSARSLHQPHDVLLHSKLLWSNIDSNTDTQSTQTGATIRAYRHSKQSSASRSGSRKCHVCTFQHTQKKFLNAL